MKKKPAKKKTQKPAPIKIDADTTCRCIRGPNGSGEWYWTVKYKMEKKEGTLFSMWATPSTLIDEYNRRRAAGLPAKREGKATTPKTVKALTAAWMNSIQSSNRAASTKYRYNTGRRMIDRTIGDTELISVTPAMMEDWREEVLKVASQNTYNATAKIFAHAWKWGFRRGFTATSAIETHLIARPKEAREKHTPSDTEMEAIWEHLDCLKWERVALEVCRYTGCRVGEASVLQWEDINFNQERVTLTGKTGARHVPLFPELKEILLDWKENYEEKPDYYSVTYGTAGQNLFGRSTLSVTHKLSPALQDAAKKAKIKHRITVHSLRRWFISRLKRAGVDVKTAADMCGNSPAVLLKYYAETSQDDMRAAVEKMRKL